MHELADRVVIITGAAGNLGTAAAVAVRRAGARTVLVDRSLEALRHAHPDAERAGHLFVGDVDLTEEGPVGEVIERTVERFATVDALVNTVGAYRAGRPVHEEELATWDFLLRLNVRTSLLSCRAVLPAMLRRGRGAIVNVASRDALAGAAGAAAYAASKAALLRLTESLAEEVRGRGVRANCILPGAIDTPQNRAAIPEAEWTELVPAQAVADVILFLVSDAARAVSGAAIPAEGPVAGCPADRNRAARAASKSHRGNHG